MPSRPVIGITVDPGADPSGGRALLKEEYARAVFKAGGAPVAVPICGDPGAVFDFFEFLDGILIPGGDDIAPSYYGEAERFQMKLVPAGRTDFEISLIKAAFYGEAGRQKKQKDQKPVLAICYGMQLINVALGGSLYQDIESDYGISGRNGPVMEHRRGMHEIIIKRAGLLPAGRFMVNSFHHQAVSRPAGGLRPIAFSEDGLVEALCSPVEKHPFFVGVQWHPERMDGDPVSDKLFASFIEASRKKYGRKI